jgi:hypothetical protein
LQSLIRSLYLRGRFRPLFGCQNIQKQAHFSHAGSDSTLSVAKCSAKLLCSGESAIHVLRWRLEDGGLLNADRHFGHRRFSSQTVASQSLPQSSELAGVGPGGAILGAGMDNSGGSSLSDSRSG